MGQWANSLAPRRDVAVALSVNNFQTHYYRIVAWALKVKLLSGDATVHHLTNEKLTLVPRACCRHTTSHIPIPSWPSSMSPYGITRPHWVNAPALVSMTLKSMVKCQDVLNRCTVKWTRSASPALPFLGWLSVWQTLSHSYQTTCAVGTSSLVWHAMVPNTPHVLVPCTQGTRIW